MINNSAPSDILDGLLFVGNAACAQQSGGDFDLVVNCTKNLPAPAAAATRFLRLPVDDVPEEALALFRLLRETDALRTIDETIARGQRCLVHCMAGAQRSAAVAACFLVAHRGLDADAAIAYVRARRPAAFFFGIVNFERTIRMMASATDENDDPATDA